MDDGIRIRSGDLNGRTEMPRLRHSEIRADGKKIGSELGFHEGENALYVGTKKGNVRLCGAGDTAALSARIDALSKLIEEITARLDALTPNG